MKDGLIAGLREHLKKCYSSSLFIPNPEECVTVACKEIVGTIDRLGVNQRDCKVELEALYPSKDLTWDFDFEHTLVNKKLNELKEKCINANFIPAMTAFDIPIMKKDMPLAEECLSHGGKLNYQLSALKVGPKDCATALYHTLLEEVADFDDSLDRLGEVTNKEFCTVLHDRFKRDLENKVAMHFLKCEEQGLFPENKLQCISRQCKEDEEKIASFKVTKEECENHPRNFVLHTQFSYENLLIQDKLKEYQQKCIDENKLPYKKIGTDWVTKSEYETQYKLMERAIAALGQDEESTWPESNIKIIPFLKLQSEIKGFKVDKEHCKNVRILAPLKANIDQYILLWRNSGFEVPQSTNELEDLVTQFARDCAAKHFD
ncbi:MAG: hypothetical protein LUC43_03580 [Burkholderiales bacterium]|nr:hypothetical protein [Burkholderiales bacterium]